MVHRQKLPSIPRNLKTIYIFRHGETDWNVAERFQGHIDIPLNDNGRNQAKQLAEKVSSYGLEAVLSSDLSRAVETAQIVAHTLRIPVIQDIRLREAHLGEAQGKTRSELEAHFGSDLVKKWKSFHLTDADVCYPGGETGLQVFKRVLHGIKDFFKENSFTKIGIATHGGVIRRVMQNIMPTGSSPVPIPNGIVYQIHYDQQNENLKPVPINSS